MKVKDTSLDIGMLLSRVRNQVSNLRANSGSNKNTIQSGDRIELSNGAKYINEIRNTLASVQEIRTELVKDIQKAIKAGGYFPDVQAIAANIIKGSLEEALSGGSSDG